LGVQDFLSLFTFQKTQTLPSGKEVLLMTFFWVLEGRRMAKGAEKEIFWHISLPHGESLKQRLQHGSLVDLAA
jgi:hypothetical protein